MTLSIENCSTVPTPIMGIKTTILKISLPMISRLSVTFDASRPDSQAENASPKAAAETKTPANISRPARGLPNSSRTVE